MQNSASIGNIIPLSLRRLQYVRNVYNPSLQYLSMLNSNHITFSRGLSFCDEFLSPLFTLVNNVKYGSFYWCRPQNCQKGHPIFQVIISWYMTFYHNEENYLRKQIRSAIVLLMAISRAQIDPFSGKKLFPHWSCILFLNCWRSYLDGKSSWSRQPEDSV